MEPRNGERNSCQLVPLVSLENPSGGCCCFCLWRSSLVAALSRPADGKRHTTGTKKELPTAFVLVKTSSTKQNIPMPSLPFEPLFLLCDRQHASLRVASFHSNQTHSNPLPSISLPLFVSLCVPMQLVSFSEEPHQSSATLSFLARGDLKGTLPTNREWD